MSVTRIASRYAKSLVELAHEQGRLDRALEDMKLFQEYLKNDDFRVFIKSPVIQEDKKAKIIDQFFKKKFDDLTFKFIVLLVRKQRDSYLPEIAEAFIQHYKKFRGISTVIITIAKPLSKKSLDAIRKKLEGSSAAKEQIEVQTQIDEDLIGGFVLEFEDFIYDASVANKLEELKKESFEENLYTSKIISR